MRPNDDQSNASTQRNPSCPVATLSRIDYADATTATTAPPSRRLVPFSVVDIMEQRRTTTTTAAAPEYTLEIFADPNSVKDVVRGKPIPLFLFRLSPLLLEGNSSLVC